MCFRECAEKNYSRRTHLKSIAANDFATLALARFARTPDPRNSGDDAPAAEKSRVGATFPPARHALGGAKGEDGLNVKPD